MKHITEKQSDHDRKLLETQRSIDGGDGCN